MTALFDGSVAGNPGNTFVPPAKILLLGKNGLVVPPKGLLVPGKMFVETKALLAPGNKFVPVMTLVAMTRLVSFVSIKPIPVVPPTNAGNITSGVAGPPTPEPLVEVVTVPT